MSELTELFDRGLLKKERPSYQAAEKSIAVAESYVEEAEKSLGAEAYDAAVLAAYAAMFHAARAMLFKDGVREKSHWAMVEYLRMKHSDELGVEIVNSLGHYRSFRHSTAYGLGERATKTDAKGAIGFAREMIEKVRKVAKL